MGGGSGWKEKRDEKLKKFQSRAKASQSLANRPSMVETLLTDLAASPLTTTPAGPPTPPSDPTLDGDDEEEVKVEQEGEADSESEVEGEVDAVDAIAVASLRSFSTVHTTEEGTTYFVDTRNGESFWEDPEAELGHCDTLLASNARRQRSKATFDEANGAVFFVDVATGESSWDDPEPESLEPVSAPDSAQAIDDELDIVEPTPSGAALDIDGLPSASSSGRSSSSSSPSRSPKQRNSLTLRAEAMIRAATIVEDIGATASD